MLHACAETQDAAVDWRETLQVAFDQGLPRLFEIAWLKDNVRHQEEAASWE